MTKQLILNIAEMKKDFFSESELVGILSALPAYQLAGIFNDCFRLRFCRQLEHDLVLKSEKETIFFPVFQYHAPLNGAHYFLYQIRTGENRLFPELKHINYLLMIQSGCCVEEGSKYLNLLRQLTSIQLAGVLDPAKIKKLERLVI